MSRLTKWKLEKAKVKVVFRLQFHATHVPQAGWDKLFISFIPSDSVKATSKTTKAVVRNGTCKWGDPIYETTRLLQDTRTKQYDEKLYKIVVAMGTSRSSILGEAMINLAEYADALKPFAVVLPLQGSDSGAILHVTIQLLTSKTGFREFEQQRELRERAPSATLDHSSPDESSRCRSSATDETLSHVDKTNMKESFRENFRDDSLMGDAVGPDDSDLALGFDVSSSTSESLNAEKHDISITNESDCLKSVVSGDLSGLAQNLQKEKDGHEWHHDWGSDYVRKNSDLGNNQEENIKLKGFLEDMESSINEINIEVSSLQCHANDIGSKTQDFSRILISEIGSGDQLVREVSVLKSECSKLRKEMELLHNIKAHVLYNNKDQDNVFHSLQVRWLLGLLAVEDNIREIQNKVCYGYQDRDSRLFLSDFESLLGVLLDFKRKIGQPIAHHSTADKKERGMSKTEQVESVSELDTDIYQPELDPLQYLGMSDLTSREPSSADSISAMRSKILELVQGLDESKAERDSLTKKMDQMECYYESLVQELEETQRQLLVELQNLRNEHSTCLYSISGAEAEMATLRQDMSEQTLRFTEEKKTLDALNEELDKRAMTAESALKRARLNYSTAFNHLQKDLELLSSQVVSIYETKDNLIKQAFPDPRQSLHESIQSTYGSKPMKQDTSDVNLMQFQIEKKGLKRSLHVEKDLYVEEELYEMHSRNLYLEVFSTILQETFLEASVDIRIMKAKIDELGWQLEISTEAKEMLKQRLDIALDEVCSLNEEKTTCIAKWNAVALHNQSLEANLRNITHDNLILLQKIDELERVVLESKNLKTNYETCMFEKIELAELMEKEELEKVHLQTRLSTMQSEFDALRGKFEDMAAANGNLQNSFSSLKDRLMNTLGCYYEKLTSLPMWEGGVDLELESGDLTEQLDKFLCKICENISVLATENKELMQEKSELKVERDLRKKLDNRIEELASELDEKHLMLENIDLQNFQVKLLEKMVAERESEKSFQSSEDVRNAHRESSFIEELLQCLLAADVQLTFTQIQLETYINHLEEQLSCSSKSHLEFQKKHTDLESTLSHCLINEIQCMEENSKLLISIEVLKSELESYMAKSRALTDKYDKMSAELEEHTARDGNAERNLCAHEVEQLKSLLVEHEEEIENLTVLKTEAEITVLMLQDKLNEQCGKGATELERLKNWCSDLAQRLSEQILKTEEFKRLKDYAEAECTRALEKTDYQSRLTPQQESLRIIFIKEQYETKLQELQHQLAMSKKHSEEILMKLQDAIDENEARRKAESSHLKSIYDKREKTTDYDMMKAELDCSILSLECCKEEKQKLEAFLHECKEEKLKMSKELESMRGLVQSCSSHKDIQIGKSENEDQLPSGETMVLDKSEESLALINENFRAETLRSGLDHVNKELERMKNENLIQPQDDNDSDTRFPGLEQELIHLRQVKEELQRIFPLSQENFDCGNSLERVLALEIELAESLRRKKKSTIHRQSSFLKHHADEKAIFQSFRDINNLIEEMLETKGQYASVETELKEMHDRYSKLSLKFAEVEGERQKLMMSLKIVRASKKAMLLNRSSSATLDEN